MSKILLAQPNLPKGWIDLTVGEPNAIKNTLLDLIDINQLMPKVSGNDFIYPSPHGYDKLVKYLESKHNAKVIITNGAKQALGAAFYAVKKIGIDSIGLKTPYWALLPPLAELHNLNINYHNGNALNKAELVVAPNNPDGSMIDLEDYYNKCKTNDSIIIHDAAYYTKIYTNTKLNPIGDVQIYSISKMLGLSSLRLGYVVCRNDTMYDNIQYYMEHMTVGVSRLPQMFLLNIFENLRIDIFEETCYNILQANKKIVRSIDSGILEIPEENQDGMFLWAKLKNPEAFKAAKLNIIDGEPFGDKNFVRLNIAFDSDMMQNIVSKLNANA